MSTDRGRSGSRDEPRGEPPAWSLVRPGSRVPGEMTVVLLPSYSVAPSLLEHYADRLLLLEHRHLLHLLGLHRTPARMVFVTSALPADGVVDYYLSLLPARRRHDVRARLHFLVVPDPSARSVTAKLLDRPDLVAELREMVRGLPAYVEPWNVTWDELRLSRLLDLPLHGTPPELWQLGFKSSGRRILRAAGVPVPAGREDARSVDDVVRAVAQIVRRRPAAEGVVVKTDNSGAGDGNRVVPFGRAPAVAAVRRAAESWEPRYVDELHAGAVVEELLTSPGTTFPSVQGRITPTGEVVVVSTHEQLLAGPQRQLYQGCEFPARAEYAAQLADHGEAVGRVLAGLGALGRFAVDFAAVPAPGGRWEVYGLEINLRTTGTTHPLAALASLAPGRYERAQGRWLCGDGSERCYRSTDNMVIAEWRGGSPLDVVDAVSRAGLGFRRGTRRGVVLHGLCGLEVDGRLGLTAIGATREEAGWLFDEVERSLRARAPVPRVGAPSHSPAQGDAPRGRPA